MLANALDGSQGTNACGAGFERPLLGIHAAGLTGIHRSGESYGTLTLSVPVSVLPWGSLTAGCVVKFGVSVQRVL
jgi:hypothetical protein